MGEAQIEDDYREQCSDRVRRNMSYRNVDGRVAHVEKDNLHWRISALMETDDETTIPPARKATMKEYGNSEIDDENRSETKCDETMNRGWQHVNLQQSDDVVEEVETIVKQPVRVQKTHNSN